MVLFIEKKRYFQSYFQYCVLLFKICGSDMDIISYISAVQKNTAFISYETNCLKKPCPPSEHSHGKTNTSPLFPPSFFSSAPLPSCPIKKRELRGHNGGKAGLFDPHAVLSSVFSIQPVWTGISGVDRPSAQRDKSPPANCCHIK